jgi:D-tyrosyl-tRNA(Tyr) deacylase
VQRVQRASVTVEGRLVAAIGPGLAALIGVAPDDGPADIDYTASKIREMRVFADEQGRMNRSVGEAGGSVLLVSQFTLFGDLRRGRRPGFSTAAPPEMARARFDDLVQRMRGTGVPVETGVFQAHMQVELVNDGPVTILLDSRKTF